MTDAEKLKNEFNFSLLNKNAHEIKKLKVLFEDFKSELFGSVYPIGSIYMSASAVSPESLFGGKWEQIKGRFLLGADDTYALGSIGGEAFVSLTADQNGQHNHNFNVIGNDKVTSGERYSLSLPGAIYSGEIAVNIGADWTSSGYVTIKESGSGKAHNNMPPYLAVYVWKRTA